MKKKLLVLLVVLFFLLLLVPVPAVYKDGGTRTYTSLTYKAILWHTVEGKEGLEIHLFPNNFHGLDYYR